MIVAGQGTIGIEILDQLGRSPARIVIPCGGGGLASGIALACPDAEIVVVEPEGWDDMKHSLEAGEIVPVGPGAPTTFCDAIMTPRVSPLTLGILQGRNAKAVPVGDAEVADAIRFAWDKHQLMVEPGAAVALAALLAGVVSAGEQTVVVVSGGNIDPALHARIVSEAA
jgi:threonine dehydratase